MSNIFTTDSMEWQPVRPEITRNVFGKTLFDDGMKVVLTRVAPGGGFPSHRDPYGHLFYFLSGEGIVRLEETEIPVQPGLVVRVAPGEQHSYENRGTDDLLLVSVNLPPL